MKKRKNINRLFCITLIMILLLSNGLLRTHAEGDANTTSGSITEVEESKELITTLESMMNELPIIEELDNEKDTEVIEETYQQLVEIKKLYDNLSEEEKNFITKDIINKLEATEQWFSEREEAMSKQEQMTALISQFEEKVLQLPTLEQLKNGEYTDTFNQIYQKLIVITDEYDEFSEEEQLLIDEKTIDKLQSLHQWFSSQMSITATVAENPNQSSVVYSQNKMDDFKMVGPYQFNIAGNSNTKGKYHINSSYAVPNHSDTAAEAECGTLPSQIGGKATTATNSNSSSSVLEKKNDVKIVKAYLVVTTTINPERISGKTAPLAKYGFFFKGPQGNIKHYYPNKIYYDQTSQRNACYLDVTDFVKKEGYGNYTAINIPYANMAASTWSVGSDLFGAWKLVVVEEDATLPLRMVCLKLGGTSVISGQSTNAEISGDGLVVKGGTETKPSGELLFSMDGYDMVDNTQTLQYSTSTSGGNKKLAESPYRSNNYFYTGMILHNGEELDNTPKAFPAYQANSTTRLTAAALHGGAVFDTYNTDFEVMKINDESNSGSMQLSGGEKQVTMKADTSSAPTLLSALGLAIDIVVPEFESDITVTNLTQHYTTADTGYDRTENYALPNDRLKVSVACKNTSNSSDKIGIQNAKLTVETPAFLTIEKDTIKGKYIDKDGQVTELTATVNTKENKVEFALKSDITVSSGGHFEISYEGEAKSTRTYTEYTNRTSVQGTFVDDDGNHYESFSLENMGISYAETASDILKFKLTVNKDGNGDVTGTGKYPYDKSAVATWTPKEGSYTKLLLVDGEVRDDLVLDETATIQMNSKDHTVFANFVDGKRPVKDYYTISVSGDSHVEDLTPSKMLASGQNYTVSWSVQEGYSVSEILVDGYAYPVSNEGSITFKGILADHTVQIHTVSDYVYVQTVVKGSGSITPSALVRRGDNYLVEWKGKNEDSILSTVTINGKVVYNETAAKATVPTKWNFTNLQNSQIVEVVYREEGKTENDLCLVTTQLLNGPGSITPSQTVTSNSSLKIQWQHDKNYEVSKVVYYQGSIRHEMPVTDNFIELKDITEDCIVQVYLKDKTDISQDTLYEITTSLVGGPGSISPNQIQIVKGSQRTIQWEIEDGYKVVSVMIDGNIWDSLTEAKKHVFKNITSNHQIVVNIKKDVPPTEKSDLYKVDTHKIGNGTISESVIVKPGASHVVTWSPKDGESVLSVTVDGVKRPDLIDKGKIEFVGIGKNHTVDVVFSVDQDEPKPEDFLYYISTKLYGGVGTISSSIQVKQGETYLGKWTADKGYSVKTILIDGIVVGSLQQFGTFNFDDIQDNHEVVVVLESEKEQNPIETLLNVSTSIKGPGTITQSMILNRNDNHKVEWNIEDGWELDKVYVDGVLVAETMFKDNSIDFTNLQANHHVEVVLKKTDSPDESVDDIYPYKVETIIKGGIANITPTTYYAHGEDAEVEWKIDPFYEISRIYIDGVLREDLKDNKISFANLSKNHKVEIILMPLKPVDVAIEKTASNMTHPDGPNKVGDTILYTLRAVNKTPHSQWDNVVIQDQIPASLTIDLDSIVLIGKDGSVQKVTKDNVSYDKNTQILSVKVNTLLENESFIVSFKAVINEKAVSANGGISIKNIASVVGTDADNKPLPKEWSEEVLPGSKDDEKIMPLDPEPYYHKVGEMKTSKNNKLYVGDSILYTLEVGNKKAGSLWADVIVQDQLPEGLTPDLETLCIILPNGNKIVPEDYTYDSKNHTLTVYIGDVYGLDKYKVEFEAIINEKALDSDIGNQAIAFGYDPEHKPENKPSSKDPLPNADSESGVLFEEIDKPVYPKNSSGKVIKNVSITVKPNQDDDLLTDVAPSQVKTGDMVNIGLWIIISLCSIICIGFVLKKKTLNSL